MKWVPSVLCDKSNDLNTDETLSHACPGLDGDKTEGWSSNSTLCVSVLGGEQALFGVKDGKGCSDDGPYSLQGLSTPAYCDGPMNVCDGKQDGECEWRVDTDECSDTPLCPTDNVCDVVMPCSSDVGELSCHCTEYRFVRT